jgi:translation initiation factor 1
MRNDNSKLVYSTDRPVSRKEKPFKKDVYTSLSPARQNVTVRHDRKGRGGKSVTVVEGIQLVEKDMKLLLKEMKSKLGTGGAVKGTSLEIQGEHCDTVIEALKAMSYRPKRSGG